MTSPGDFDPVKAVQGARQQRAAEEAEKRRRQAQGDLYHAELGDNRLKLLRYADEQLEDIRNPIVSEFVISETWWKRRIFGEARHHRRQKARYYGSWLALSSTRPRFDHHTASNNRVGLVKLRQPRAGYAFVKIDGWDPRNVAYFDIALTNYFGEKLSSSSLPDFRIVASLEEVTETIDT